MARATSKLFALGLVAGLFACVESTSSTTGGTTTNGGPGGTKATLVAQLSSGVIAPTYQAFLADAVALETAASAYKSSLSAGDKSALQLAWKKAMASWQRAELMLVGPAGPSDTVSGGLDLRDEVYSWPVSSPCVVDQKLVEKSYTDVDAFAGQLKNARGLDALEYLLFYDGDKNACAIQNNINQDGSWNAIVGELARRRADYAHTVTILIRRTAEALWKAWDPNGDNFSATFASEPGEAVGEIVLALYYLDIVMKERKLETPLGLVDCTSAACPEKLEHPHGGWSKRALAANLAAFRLLFQGGDSPSDFGFDDYLVALGETELSETMLSLVSEAEAALEAIEGDDLAAALVSSPEKIAAVHAPLKALATELKTRFVCLMGGEGPEPPGDND